jgi:hypothetical protein
MSEKVKRYLEHARGDQKVLDSMRAAFEQATHDGHFDAVVHHGREHGHEFSADELIGFITGGKPKQTGHGHG